jgi:stearoyl-CoA desaturase (Delta-9 desaturase)
MPSRAILVPPQLHGRPRDVPEALPAGNPDEPLAWSTIGGLGVLHAGGIAGLVWIFVHPSLATLIAAAVFYVVSGLGITAGYHRLFAHRTYRAAAPVRWFLLAAGATAFQNSALSWSADHRAHHSDTDGDGDPHAITRGVWFAHISWLFRRREASADVTRLTDLWAVPSIRLQHRWYAVIAIGLGLVAPAMIATLWGDPIGGLLVAGFLRSAVLLQATFCVNSLAHLLGTRRFDAHSSARDSTVTALVTFGEGYHNFHHRFPYDYRNGMRWWQYDPSKWMISLLARVGLATNTRTASTTTIARAMERAQLPFAGVAPAGAGCSSTTAPRSAPSSGGRDRLDLLGGELQVPGGGVVLEVLDRAGAGDRQHHG